MFISHMLQMNDHHIRCSKFLPYASIHAWHRCWTELSQIYQVYLKHILPQQFSILTRGPPNMMLTNFDDFKVFVEFLSLIESSVLDTEVKRRCFFHSPVSLFLLENVYGFTGDYPCCEFAMRHTWRYAGPDISSGNTFVLKARKVLLTCERYLLRSSRSFTLKRTFTVLITYSWNTVKYNNFSKVMWNLSKRLSSSWTCSKKILTPSEWLVKIIFLRILTD